MFGISGYVLEILEKGFVLKLEKEMPGICWRFSLVRKMIVRKILSNHKNPTQEVSTQVEGSKLGLKIGDYVSVRGGLGENVGSFLSSSASKRAASGDWESVPINHSDLKSFD